MRNGQTLTTILAAIFIAVIAAAMALEPGPDHGLIAQGYTRLFDGATLNGWQGLVADPPARARMPPAERADAQRAADARMRGHWAAREGVLRFDGKGDNLCTIEPFGDFELDLEWRIPPGGDSGIYLRGTPQVQIWDNPLGSGGLYNNKRHASNPLLKADRAPGTWNRFHIVMRGDTVSVWLNGRLVTDRVPFENYWEPGQAIYRSGSIELQSHGEELWFRNILVKRLTVGS